MVFCNELLNLKKKFFIAVYLFADCCPGHRDTPWDATAEPAKSLDQTTKSKNFLETQIGISVKIYVRAMGSLFYKLGAAVVVIPEK